MKYNLNAASLKYVFNNQNISGGCTLTNKLKDSSFLPMFNLEEMKRALEKQKCPVHHQKAQVTVIRRGAPDWIRIALFFGIWTVYKPVCTSMGFTIGNYLKGIRVRSASDNAKKINVFQGILRYVLKIFFGWLSFVTIHSNKQRRAIHDLAAGSVMIRK